jgi:hypothetical protein
MSESKCPVTGMTKNSAAGDGTTNKEDSRKQSKNAIAMKFLMDCDILRII